MCGITGFWQFEKTTVSHPEKILEKMMGAIQTRGPDSCGSWSNEKQGIFLGHRRLSIQDLSPAGHQPMVSHSGRSVIIYNGEVYNPNELRQELIAEGVTFRGHSDTEVILEAIERWGIEKVLPRLIGMFAFALWMDSKLYLVRDRLGIKPLYWGIMNDTLFFGSQPKSFFNHPAFKSEIDPTALVSYLQYGYVPAPQSIFKNIHKQKPGTYLMIDAQKSVKEFYFWNLKNFTGNPKMHPKSQQDVVDQARKLLRDAVTKRMLADVPLGAFLSGGIDSSLVTAIMQEASDKPIQTFSIGFHDKSYNEAPYAKAIAQYLGTDHHELYVTEKEALDLIPEIPHWCDEPFADSSQIPTYLVSKLARKHVTVSLSGDGGDELFGGYSRYLFAKNMWDKIQLLPLWMRSLGCNTIQLLSPETWDSISTYLPKKLAPSHLGDKAYKLANILKSPDGRALYQQLVSQCHESCQLVNGTAEATSLPFNEASKIDNFIEKMQFIDTITYLPDDILTKVDRASMAVSLEARVPLLDHRLVEFSWTLPMSYKIRGGTTKWILREILNQYIPKKLTHRPKMGFGIPVGKWLLTDLRPWAEDLLDPQRMREEGYFNVALVQQRWQEHISGTRNWHSYLWPILMFQSWQRLYGIKAISPTNAPL